jgi:hypothetical protein
LFGFFLFACALFLSPPPPAGPAGAVWAGVVAAAAAFAVHSGFDFVWHLPAVVLTVTLLVGVVLPAPDGAHARTPFHPALGEESDENKIAS